MDPLIRYFPSWVTVAVTALPVGWRNVYAMDDGTADLSDCPALLLQEHRSTYVTLDWADGRQGERTESKDEPYDTRVVYADLSYGDPELAIASEGANYVTTISPSDGETTVALHLADHLKREALRAEVKRKHLRTE